MSHILMFRINRAEVLKRHRVGAGVHVCFKAQIRSVLCQKNCNKEIDFKLFFKSTRSLDASLALPVVSVGSVLARSSVERMIE